MRAGLYFVAMIGVLVGVPGLVAQQDPAFQRAQHLQRGINLSMWYAQDGQLYDPDEGAGKLASFTTAKDFRLIHELGFDHVRVSLDPVPLMQPAAGSSSGDAVTLRPEAMARLDATVAQITAEGLVVVLDIHPETPWKHAVTTTDDGMKQFFLFWQSFAGHFASTDPDKVYFEVLNEPEGVNVYQWAGEQARAIALIREKAPRHTIIATGASWGSLDSLVQMEPVRLNNVIYNLHDYEPMEFTHQGATWAGDPLKPLRDVPYPSTPANVAGPATALPDGAARSALAKYGEQRWDVQRMQQRLALAVAWAAKRHVPLWCGEFGVYREYAPAADRARWIADMRTTLEAGGIGWAMWDYQSAFGMVTKKNGVTTVDAGVAKALGLKQSR